MNLQVTAAFLSKLLDLIETNVKSGSEGAPEELRSVQVFYDNTLAYIQVTVLCGWCQMAALWLLSPRCFPWTWMVSHAPNLC